MLNIVVIIVNWFTTFRGAELHRRWTQLLTQHWNSSFRRCWCLVIFIVSNNSRGRLRDDNFWHAVFCVTVCG